MVTHLRIGKNGMNAVFPACKNGQRTRESGCLCVSPKDFHIAMDNGDACKCCIPIYNKRKAEFKNNNNN
jgi:hypothetical protein